SPPRRFLAAFTAIALLLTSHAATIWAQKPATTELTPLQRYKLPVVATRDINAQLHDPTTLTMEGLGATQGVSMHDGKVYLYGDAHDGETRVGVIREYNLLDDGKRFEPTGKVIWLRRNGQPLLVHPTGLTWNQHHGTFLGDTVETKATIYHLDW